MARNHLEFDNFESGSAIDSTETGRDGYEARQSACQVHEDHMQPGHRRFVLTDSVAFRYLEEDPSTVVLDRRRVLDGYECYVVEQWACSRSHVTSVITTYTGDPSHKIVVGVLGVPADERAWSRLVSVYFEALHRHHAHSRDTPLGTLMITNLSEFSSSLTVIPVPDGDVRKHRESFFVNEDLKRLGCSGRVGTTLAPPSGATENKFHQLYRTSEKIPLAGAVMELVRLCQVALVLFGKLESEYADGLLCDHTETAVKDWWADIGNEIYSIEPHDGVLGPTTVAALLGTLTGARNRMNAYGAPVGKDVFEVETTKRGIAYFQKSQRIPKTRRLDRKTLASLHRATAKAASGEGWAVPKAVKSTVAELSGKGGEMVMDIVGGRDKAGIADVETTDIERFVQLVHGGRSKWLWYGKARKHHGNMFGRLSDEDGKPQRKESKDEDEPAPAATTRRESTAESMGLSRREALLDRESRIRRATGKLGDARAGIGGRLKDAVGLRSHQPKQWRVEHEGTFRQTSGRESLDLPNASASLETQRGTFEGGDGPSAAGDRPSESGAVLTDEPEAVHEETEPEPTNDPIAGAIYRGVDLDTLFEADVQFECGPSLRHTNSFSTLITHRSNERQSRQRWPRRLSLSIAEDSVLRWRSVVLDCDDTEAQQENSSPRRQLACEYLGTEEAQANGERLARLGNMVSVWVEGTIDEVQELKASAERTQQELDEIHCSRLSKCNSLREDVDGVIAQERAVLQESIKNIETLGAKLEYEVNALRGRVEDVEDGVTEFEGQVLVVEGMVQALESECQPSPGWLDWLCRRAAGGGR